MTAGLMAVAGLLVLVLVLAVLLAALDIPRADR